MESCLALSLKIRRGFTHVAFLFTFTKARKASSEAKHEGQMTQS